MPTYVITPTFSVQGDFASGSSLVLNSVFVPLHTDLLLIPIVANFGAGQTPTGGTYGAQALTLLNRVTAGGIQAMMYYLHRPTPGTAAITIGFNASTDGALHAFIIAGTRAPKSSQVASAGGAATSAATTFNNFATFPGEGASDLFLTIFGTPTGNPTITPTVGQVADTGFLGTGIGNGSFGYAKPYKMTAVNGVTHVDSYTMSPGTPYAMVTAHLEYYGIEDGQAVVVR